jgi:type IV pilus assembly protein PilB
LYASLGIVARPDRKTLTIEDPVEIRLDSITQSQVNEKAGLTFASALRSFLRADPDVVLVGEIRDKDTAALAAQAALTGHLVLSTLHTNEAAGAPTRLANLGLDGFIIASALKGVLAQRLLRRLCTKCATPYEPTTAELERLRWPTSTLGTPERLFKARGCSECDHIGYRGRVPVGEIVTVNDDIAQAIIDRAPSAEIDRLATIGGTIGLHADACQWALEGATSGSEILRVGV